MKLGQVRKSISCPKFCKLKDCYERTEEKTFEGKKYLVWVVHCKTLDRICNQAIGLTNKIRL